MATRTSQASWIKQGTQGMESYDQSVLTKAAVQHGDSRKLVYKYRTWNRSTKPRIKNIAVIAIWIKEMTFKSRLLYAILRYAFSKLWESGELISVSNLATVSGSCIRVVFRMPDFHMIMKKLWHFVTGYPHANSYCVFGKLFYLLIFFPLKVGFWCFRRLIEIVSRWYFVRLENEWTWGFGDSKTVDIISVCKFIRCFSLWFRVGGWHC